jgi:hypothetical protein
MNGISSKNKNIKKINQFKLFLLNFKGLKEYILLKKKKSVSGV